MKIHANARTCPNSRKLLVKRIERGELLASGWPAGARGRDGLLDRSPAPQAGALATVR